MTILCSILGVLAVILFPGYVWLSSKLASHAYFREKLKYDKAVIHQAVDLTGDPYEEHTDSGEATR